MLGNYHDWGEKIHEKLSGAPFPSFVHLKCYFVEEGLGEVEILPPLFPPYKGGKV